MGARPENDGSHMFVNDVNSEDHTLPVQVSLLIFLPGFSYRNVSANLLLPIELYERTM